MSENTEQDKENTDTTDNEDKKKYPNVYVSIAVASIIIASPFIIYNYFFKSSTPSSIEMPKMPEMPNPFATTEIESKLTSIQDAMAKMENKMDEVDKKVTDLSTKPEPSSAAPTPEDTGGIFGNIGNMFGTDAPAVAPAVATIAPVMEDTSTIEIPIKEEKQSSVFDLFSSNEAVTQPTAPAIVANPIVANPIVANPIVANPIVAEPIVAEPIVAEQNNEIPQINNELNNNANIENPFKETIQINETDSKMTPAIGEDINQPMVPPQFGQPINPQINITGGKTRKRRKYKKRKSKKVLVV
jgi:hypothetical protein